METISTQSAIESYRIACLTANKGKGCNNGKCNLSCEAAKSFISTIKSLSHNQNTKKKMITLEIIGNIGADATIKDINGQKYISFSVANTDTYTTNTGERKETTTWVSCLKKENLQYLNTSKKVRKYLSEVVCLLICMITRVRRLRE